MQEIELVDSRENVIGYGDKLEVHRLGILHRAFSIFLWDVETKKILIQKRAEGKYHSGGLWSNSCCSHKYKGEEWLTSFARCLKEELGIIDENLRNCVEDIGKFQYYSDFGDMKEHEIDHVVLYVPSYETIAHICPNPREISSIRWMTCEELERELEVFEDGFTSWLPMAFLITNKKISVL